MADFTSTSVGELRQMLVDSGKFTKDEAEKIRGKSNLVEAVLALNSDEESDDASFNELFKQVSNQSPIPLDNIDSDIETDDEAIPSYNSPEWHDFVMKQFTDDELDNGYPTLYGLRRVSELLLGSIIQSGPTNISSPTNENSPGRATCVYTVVFDWADSGQERAFSAVAGAWPGNTDEAYAIYIEAIAESRAEARALRKALKLRVAAAEEIAKVKPSHKVELVSTGEYNENDPIQPVQIQFLKLKCKEMNLSLDKLLMKETGKNLEDLTKGEAKTLVGLLNSYQTKTKDSLAIPDDIRS